MINDINLLDLSKTYSYADYLQWTFQERLELFKGKIFKMPPAPNSNHQKVSRQLLRKFLTLFQENKCQVFHAPFDVRLLENKNQKEDNKIYTVVQPDICIICDETKIDERGCVGAPDLIVEILSPGNTKKEMREKYSLYEEAGVREYWIVQPSDKNFLLYILQNHKFIGLQPFTEDDIITSIISPDLKITMAELFSI